MVMQRTKFHHADLNLPSSKLPGQQKSWQGKQTRPGYRFTAVWVAQTRGHVSSATAEQCLIMLRTKFHYADRNLSSSKLPGQQNLGKAGRIGQITESQQFE